MDYAAPMGMTQRTGHLSEDATDQLQGQAPVTIQPLT